MKISKLEFENFRNFKGHCYLEFPTDGSISVIYGPNGVGKTTLHQLFQWIFYGEVHFNKTASQKMYNLELEKEADYNEIFCVTGTIDFEHPNRDGVIEKYSIHREWRYRKGTLESKKISETCHLLKLIDDDWKKVTDEPSTVIEQILPSGLSQYFFFDGESMIADLNQKGKDSAKSLRKALYSIFDLDIYEQALIHIGTQSSGTSTVLGKLYWSKSESCSNSSVIIARGDLHQTQSKVEKLTEDIKNAEAEIARYKKEIQDLSEIIGSTQSQAVLEARRKDLKKEIKTLEEAVEREKKNFGNSIMAQYPNLFLSRVVEEARLRIGLKVEEEKLLPGLKKELIETLLKEDICICGNQIGEKERAKLNDYLKMFPPLSYKYIYDQFKQSALRWSATYDQELLVKHIEYIFKVKSQISSLHQRIRDVEQEQKQTANVDSYIAQRNQDEDSLAYWQKKVNTDNQALGVQKQLLKQRMRKLDDLLKSNEANKEVEKQIDLMEAVRTYFEAALNSSAKKYSAELGQSIQQLLNQMLTSTRQVSMTPKFELSVMDSYGDEAKSEGQFAVVSFAYIGGIFKLLSEVPELSDKEYPLILDGPFSKLDVLQRQNVINVIPSYAPQVILFSKDDINGCFNSDITDHVWTIYSNDERNVSYIEKRYDPEVFRINGTEFNS